MRVLHFSDIHIGIGLGSVPWTRWLSKRALGGANLLLGRNRHFLNARKKMDALAAFGKEQRIDLVICTGDYTALGLEREFRDARASVEPLMDAPLGFVGVPGNHDLYVRDVVRKRRFERHFGDTFATDLPQYRVDGTWPQVRLLDDGVAVVGVNSARPNPPWRSSGRIPPEQLDALRNVLHDSALRDRFVFVITHYSPCLPDGEPDRKLHGLVNVDEFLKICGEVDRGAILCGHVHHRFYARLPQLRVPVFCGGSTTMDHREGLWVFDVDGNRVRATPGSWKQDGYRLAPDSAVGI